MKIITSLVLLFNITPAMAHTGHSSNAFIFAATVTTAILLFKPMLKIIKAKAIRNTKNR